MTLKETKSGRARPSPDGFVLRQSVLSSSYSGITKRQELYEHLWCCTTRFLCIRQSCARSALFQRVHRLACPTNTTRRRPSRQLCITIAFVTPCSTTARQQEYIIQTFSIHWKRVADQYIAYRPRGQMCVRIVRNSVLSMRKPAENLRTRIQSGRSVPQPYSDYSFERQEDRLD